MPALLSRPRRATAATLDTTRAGLAAIMGGLARLDALARSRAALGRLDAGRLRDIGLAPGEARREAARPAWDVPASWRR